jgi:two-component system, response regulator / RNA-binding antiterminator
MPASEVQCRRVLIAHERHAHVDLLANVIAGLGHDAVVRQLDAAAVADAIAHEHPEVVLVGFDTSAERALELVSAFVRDATCPVIALLADNDPDLIRETARRGVFACVLRDDAAELEGAIDVAVERFAEYRRLEEAFGRRAVIEQAKGILMERNAIDAGAAFLMLREHSQNSGRKLIDVAEGVVKSHQLLGSPAVGTSQSAETE